MKRFLIGLFLVGLAGYAIVDPLTSLVLEVDEVSTNTAETAACTSEYAVKITGEVKALSIDVSGVDPDMDMELRTTTDGDLGKSRVIWTEDDVTADAYYDLVVKPVLTSDGGATTNVYVPMILMGDYIELVATDAKTNLTTSVRITLIMEDK